MEQHHLAIDADQQSIPCRELDANGRSVASRRPEKVRYSLDSLICTRRRGSFGRKCGLMARMGARVGFDYDGHSIIVARVHISA
ncbi:hypothetical protein Y032_0235g3200 [Ancylostoma ceylanicum]|uniref:Uncharacterized protein n=1 Tax=Ancylostoma ceylanicum TaxID=53326 RepID=A0A016SFW1_9BILA|nr:hypothetical protein Y032_0235g3200 [Ancylostoma ceylanicum]